MEIYSLAKIKELLPYEYPMLLLDRMWKESDTKFYGLKCVTCNEEFFMGHFPGHKIMPGVLQLEATFQTAVVGLRHRLDPENKLDIYAKIIKNVKFRKPNVPGDRLLIEVDVTELKDGEATINAINKNNSGVCSQAQIVLSTRPRVYNVAKPELFTRYDRSDSLHMDLGTIQSYIPHRYPFCLVDYIHSAEGERITAIKNISYNEPMMHNYSNGYSVLSGAIQCEIIAQAGCAQTLAKPANKGKLAFFGSINHAEFYHPIHPGDQLRIELVLPDTNSRAGKGRGEVYVENTKVSYGEITFIIVDK